MRFSRFTKHACLLLLLSTASSLSQTSWADDLLGGDLGLPGQSSSNNLIAPPPIAEDEPPEPRLSPADAANLVRQQTGGQVMSVSTKRLQSGTIYGVKILNSGRMRVVHVDGQTGELIAP